MATGNASTQMGGVPNMACGVATGDGTALTLTVGFKARSVTVVNTTDATVWEWMEGMAATQSLKTVTAGTMVIDTGSAILINADKTTITLSAAVNVSGKALVWSAEA